MAEGVSKLGERLLVDCIESVALFDEQWNMFFVVAFGQAP